MAIGIRHGLKFSLLWAFWNIGRVFVHWLWEKALQREKTGNEEMLGRKNYSVPNPHMVIVAIMGIVSKVSLLRIGMDC